MSQPDVTWTEQPGEFNPHERTLDRYHSKIQKAFVEDAMALYQVGMIVGRCHLQKPIMLSNGVEAIPIGPTGFAGEIHDVRALLGRIGYNFTRKHLDTTIANFLDTGHSVLLKFPLVEADTFAEAIELMEARSNSSMGSLSVISANPTLPLCAFAQSGNDSGVKFFIPADRKIFHATNIGGYLDAGPAIHGRALADPKFDLLLRLFRASLREIDIDHQLLFQLILFEEASDEGPGGLAERLRRFLETHGITGDLNLVALDCGLSLPTGKDMVDAIVKLRNAAAHNGKIDAESLRTYGGEWLIPLLSQKGVLHKAVCECLRYMFCALVGHTRDAKATRITGPFEIRYD